MARHLWVAQAAAFPRRTRGTWKKRAIAKGGGSRPAGDDDLRRHVIGRCEIID